MVIFEVWDEGTYERRYYSTYEKAKEYVEYAYISPKFYGDEYETEVHDADGNLAWIRCHNLDPEIE